MNATDSCIHIAHFYVVGVSETFVRSIFSSVTVSRFKKKTILSERE